MYSELRSRLFSDRSWQEMLATGVFSHKHLLQHQWTETMTGHQDLRVQGNQKLRI